jgi:uncharacterized protein YjiS (DUF1127 family)
MLWRQVQAQNRLSKQPFEVRERTVLATVNLRRPQQIIRSCRRRHHRRSSMDLLNIVERIQISLAWRREYRRVHAELDSYTQREMKADLGLNRSDIPAIAAMAADQHIDRFVRPQPALQWLWSDQDYRRLAHS